jgi:hypothetical protein
VSDPVLRPVYGLLQWCEWLVPEDKGKDAERSLDTRDSHRIAALFKYETLFPVLRKYCFIFTYV